jgi:crotonobetainyl-CoA:carnitine CoA-transferase CaiB-like acyl-CoA transferase
MSANTDSGGRPGPLHGVRVVELASVHGAAAGKLFGDLGAQVVVVEPPGGHESRSIGPFLDDRPDAEGSLWWWNYNTSKKGVTLDLSVEKDRAALERLLQEADFFLESEPPGALDERGVTRSELLARMPGLIWISISPFGRSGAGSRRPSTDLTLMAGAGPVWNCGYDDHSLPPVRGGGHQSANVASIHAAMGALVALLDRDVTGKGQHVDVNIHAALNVTTELGSYSWLVAKETVRRQTGRHASTTPTSPTQLQAADGNYVVLGFPPRSAVDYRSIVQWLDDLGLGQSFPDRVLLEMAVARGGVKITELGQDPVAMEIWNAGRAAMAFIATHLPARACFDGFQERGIVCGIVNPPEDLLTDVHSVARGFPVAVRHEDIERTITYPGAPLIFGASPWRISSRAPHVDEHRGEILGLIGEDDPAPP